MKPTTELLHLMMHTLQQTRIQRILLMISSKKRWTHNIRKDFTSLIKKATTLTNLEVMNCPKENKYGKFLDNSFGSFKTTTKIMIHQMKKTRKKRKMKNLNLHLTFSLKRKKIFSEKRPKRRKMKQQMIVSKKLNNNLSIYKKYRMHWKV